MISEKIVAAIRPICPIYAEVADTTSVPYAAYSINERPLYDKDGPWARTADVTILIVSGSFDESDHLADAVEEALNALRPEMLVAMTSRDPYESTDAQLYAVELMYQFTEEIS